MSKIQKISKKKLAKMLMSKNGHPIFYSDLHGQISKKIVLASKSVQFLNR